MGSRAAQRIRLVLPVRAWGMDVNGKPFIQMAHTLDVNRTGARLGGVKVKLAASEVIGVQYRAQKARFKVMWVGEDGTPRQDQIGLKYLADERNIWPEEVPDNRGADHYEPVVLRKPGARQEEDLAKPAKPATPAAPAAQQPNRTASVTAPEAYRPATPGGIDPAQFKQQQVRPTSEKRKHVRYSCRGGVEIKRPGAKAGNWAALSDISTGGCYIETASPLAKDSLVRLQLKTEHYDVISDGIVRTIHPGVGMGLEFMHMEPSDRKFLELLLQKLAGTDAAAPIPMMPNEEITERLQKATEEMKDIERMMTSDSVDPMVLREFRASLGHVRHTAWALQEALVLESKKDDLNPVVSFLNTERIRMATRLCKNIAADLQLKQLKIERREFNELLASVEELFMRLAGVNFSMDEGVDFAAVEADSSASGARLVQANLAESVGTLPTMSVTSAPAPGVSEPPQEQRDKKEHQEEKEREAAVAPAVPANGNGASSGLSIVGSAIETEAQHFAAAAELEVAVEDVPIFKEARRQSRRTEDREEETYALAATFGAVQPAESALPAEKPERRKKKERRKKRG